MLHWTGVVPTPPVRWRLYSAPSFQGPIDGGTLLSRSETTRSRFPFLEICSGLQPNLHMLDPHGDCPVPQTISWMETNYTLFLSSPCPPMLRQVTLDEFTSTDPRSPTADDVPSSHWFPARTTTILRHTPHLQSSQTLEAFILDSSGPLRTTGE